MMALVYFNKNWEVETLPNIERNGYMVMCVCVYTYGIIESLGEVKRDCSIYYSDSIKVLGKRIRLYNSSLDNFLYIPKEDFERMC